MSVVIDYYHSPQSPWSYLGHARLLAIADAAGARIDLWPVDLGQVFPVSGGVPLAKRAPQRQAYRLVELQRFATHLGLPLNLKPKFFRWPACSARRAMWSTAKFFGVRTGWTFCSDDWLAAEQAAPRTELAAPAHSGHRP